jgi:Cu(I)/Ag(I) efflux system membrane fusion protein
MKKTLYIVSLIAIAVSAFWAGARYTQPASSPNSSRAQNSTASSRVLYYVDPMHPTYKSDRPGIAPDCGMQLEPVYAGGALVEGSRELLSSDLVQISAEKQQLFGVRVGTVEKSSGTFKLRLFGRVTPDESRTYTLNAGTSGYIQDVLEVTTGSQVRKNQLLATFSAPGAVMTIQTYLLNLGAEEHFRKSAADGAAEGQALPAAASNIQQRVDQLRELGMSNLQIEEIRRTRQFPGSIKIVAPENGFVLERNVSPGQKFDRGAQWFRIANLDHIWILADVFENEAQYFRPGARAVISLPHQGKTLTAKVSEVLSQFDPATRTLKVRLEAENPAHILRPEMFVDVELAVGLPPAVVIPAEAILDSGLHRTVFVEQAAGLFEPRAIETGKRFEDSVEVVKGLRPGERIVMSGNFLIGSESQLRGISAGSDSPAHNVSDSTSTAVHSASNSAVIDPACGMEVDPAQARAAGHVSHYRHKIYYSCSDSCKRQFDADPAKILNRSRVSTGERPHPTDNHAIALAHGGRSG